MTEPTTNRLMDWKAYLDNLMQEASAASGSGDTTAVCTVQNKLLRFEKKSPAVADELDEMALETVIKLDIANADHRIQELVEVQERYRRIRKLIDAVAADSDGS